MSDQIHANVTSPQHKGLDEDEQTERADSDIRPTDLAAVITHDRPREIQYMRWGLIPAFATDPKAVSNMWNARAETLTEKASFKNLIMSTRCLILNECFYELQKVGDDRVEWKVSPAIEDRFFKAGLWTTWRNPRTGEAIDSFTMITCDPKETEFAGIHDRMPIIMTQPERRLWMNPNATKEQLLALLKPCDAAMYNISEYSRKPLKASKPPKGKPPENFLLL